MIILFAVTGLSLALTAMWDDLFEWILYVSPDFIPV